MNGFPFSRADPRQPELRPDATVQCVVEIGGAIRRGDRAEVRRVAHKLKGSSDSLGATHLRACAQQLELGREEDSELGESQIAELGALAAQASEALRDQLSH
ncbi:MAG TPA: Hpt domain-containing protein [Solirubrobacteraceae bacterium]|nr:Hpt domain-containing protein [Solirubrobacteraceae bacterium]